MLGFLGGVFEKLFGGHMGFHTIGHEVVALVAQHADQFGGQCFVEQADNFLPIGAVAFGHCTVLHVLPCPFAQGGYIG
ncbi:hypothetical protein D3C78_1759100 [compost metagenome]